MRKTIGRKIMTIRNRYKYITRGRFMYNRPGDLRTRYSAIAVWYILHDHDEATLIRVEYRTAKAKPLTPAQWAKRYAEKHRVFIESILPSINVKNSTEWSFHRVVAWEAVCSSQK